MNEKNIRQKIFRMLYKTYDYTPITQTDAARCKFGHLATPPSGRPDILGLHHCSPSIVVEVKAMSGTSFPLDKIDDKQVKWLDRWEDKGGLGFIGLGVIDKSGSRDKLVDIYLVEWKFWKMVVSQLDRKSIPLKGDVSVSMSFAYRKMAKKDGWWEVSPAHPLERSRVRGYRPN